MDKLRQISTQTFWQLLGKAVTSISTILILSLITRRFSETGTGMLTLSLTYLAFFTLIIDFGVNAHLMSKMLEDNFELVWRKLFGFRLMLATILIPVAILGGLVWPTEVQTFKLLILIGSLMAILEPAIYVSANAIFQSRFRYDLSVLGWSTAALTTLLLIFWTDQALGLSWIMVDYSAGWLVGSLLLLYFVKGFVKNSWPIFDLKFASNLIKESWPISLTLVLNVIYFRLDAFILSAVKGFADVGIYNLAYQLFQTALVLPTFIMNGFYPLMLKSYSQDTKTFFKEIKLAVLAMFAIGLLGIVATALVGQTIINLISGGKGFVGSFSALMILSLGFPAFFISAVLMWTLVTLKRYKAMLLIYAVGLLFNGLLNLIFIPQYSYLASAWITGISEYLILLMQMITLFCILKRDPSFHSG